MSSKKNKSFIEINGVEIKDDFDDLRSNELEIPSPSVESIPMEETRVSLTQPTVEEWFSANMEWIRTVPVHQTIVKFCQEHKLTPPQWADLRRIDPRQDPVKICKILQQNNK